MPQPYTSYKFNYQYYVDNEFVSVIVSHSQESGGINPTKVYNINRYTGKEVTKEDMIIASHESIKGNYHKLKEIFIKYSYALDDKEKLKYISDYCSDELKEIILNNK